MAVTDELERSRAALLMINPAPFNAEAPPEALDGEITPVELHYVRSNFAVPTHDGTLEIGGAVDNPTTLTLDDLRAMPAVERAVTLECAGNGRLETRPLPAGEPWGDYAVSTARWKGALLSDVLAQARPAADGLEVRFDGADHGPYHLNPVLRGDRPIRAAVRALARPRPRNRSGGGDPDRLRDERPAADPRPRSPLPADRAPLVRRRLREMAATDRRPDRTVRRRVPDRPLHLRMGRSRTRTRHPDARPRPHHRPRPRRDDRRRRVHHPRKSVVRHRTRHRRPRQLHRRRRLAPAKVEPPTGPYHWQDWSLDWEPPGIGRHSLRARATDAAGNVQPDVPPWNRLGYGNNAIEVSYVDVR